ncbi:MAG: glycosyltransferase [Clostridia bacterium]|nr:glycosyltransferase [Clostridia bacterium]
MGRLMKVSATEMSLQDIRTTIRMDAFLNSEFASFRPDVVFTDSVCFWGKLSAARHHVPVVVSTSTFAFNKLSSTYMKNSLGELKDIISGMPKISREMKTLKPYGYQVKGVMSLIQSDNNTDSVVYATRDYQPYGESFSGHYAFVGPAVMTDLVPEKQKDRPLVYISLGTIINDRPDFYRTCIDALSGLPVDILIACGRYMDPASLSPLPENVQVLPYVNQLEVLSRADVFISHCGMNSASESLYMATPMVLYPQTGEQFAVARRVQELGAGVMLKDDTADGIRKAVEALLNDASYRTAAEGRSRDFRQASGAEGAAAFIENAPHQTEDRGVLDGVNIRSGLFQLGFWLVMIPLLVLLGIHFGWGWPIAASIVLNIVFGKLNMDFTEKTYRKLAEEHKRKRNADPFYCTSNITHLEKVTAEIDNGTAKLTPHDLTEN